MKYCNEKWLKINSVLYPNIDKCYWISSKGRIYNEKTNNMVKTRCLDPKNIAHHTIK